MSTDPIAPTGPYFETHTDFLEVVNEVLATVGKNIYDRKNVYHRGTFYLDVAAAIRVFLSLEFQPFMASAYNWEWWAEELEKHGKALGMDAQFAMILPDPLVDLPASYPKVTGLLDEVTAFMEQVYAQEQDDDDVGPLGRITPAECVKITHRLPAYVLPKYCFDIIKPTPQHPGYRQTWPWVEAVAEELQAIYREMGEEDRAGGSSPGPGTGIPPISWPGHE